MKLKVKELMEEKPEREIEEIFGKRFDHDEIDGF